mmetsp:Transcript_5037/g.14797  ORF Transcript_5037/g.14797 Transcript_5037/m.14797 type:complete len:280 (-) Transcript_5037:392-1231(-)
MFSSSCSESSDSSTPSACPSASSVFSSSRSSSLRSSFSSRAISSSSASGRMPACLSPAASAAASAAASMGCGGGSPIASRAAAAASSCATIGAASLYPTSVYAASRAAARIACLVRLRLSSPTSASTPTCFSLDTWRASSSCAARFAAARALAVSFSCGLIWWCALDSQYSRSARFCSLRRCRNVPAPATSPSSSSLSSRAGRPYLRSLERSSAAARASRVASRRWRRSALERVRAAFSTSSARNLTERASTELRPWSIITESSSSPSSSDEVSRLSSR